VGSIVLEDAAAIRDFGSRIDRVEGSLTFDTLEPGETLAGLDCLRSVTGDLRATNALYLPGMGSLASLEEVGEISWSRGFDMKDFLLPQATGFTSLSLSELDIQTLSLGAGSEPDVRLVELPRLESLATLQGTLAGLWMSGLSSLTTLADWGVTELRRELYVVGSPLAELGGLADVVLEEGLSVTLNDLALVNLDGLQGLSHASQLSVMQMDALTSLDGVAGSLQVEGLTLDELPQLTTLAGLEGLRFADTASPPDLVLWRMASLTDLSALVLAPTMGTVNLYDLPLATLPPWEVVQLDYLDVQGLDILVDMTGFGHLEGTTSTLHIERNPGLQTLDGLQGLRQVGALMITGNDALTSVEALHGITRIDGDVTFLNNPSLSAGAIQDLLTAIGEDRIGGEVTVMNNGP